MVKVRESFMLLCIFKKFHITPPHPSKAEQNNEDKNNPFCCRRIEAAMEKSFKMRALISRLSLYNKTLVPKENPSQV